MPTIITRHCFSVKEALPCALPPLSVQSEVQFSDNKPKSKFVTCPFSVSKANITQLREEKTGGLAEVAAWPVESLRWVNKMLTKGFLTTQRFSKGNHK